MSGMNVCKRRVTLATAALAAICAAAGPGYAATVAFDPATAEVMQGQTAEFRVEIASSGLDPFESIDLLFGSDLAGLDFAFEYDASFTTSFPPPEPSSPGIFASDIFVGGVNLDGWSPPVVIGALRVQTAALAPGTYDGAVAVRPETEAELDVSSFSMVGEGVTGELELLTGSADLVVNEAPDSDGDGVGDFVDAFPNDPSETTDTDQDGTGNNADPDDDNDGVNDAVDPSPLEPGDDPPSEDDADDAGDSSGANGGAGMCGAGAMGVVLILLPLLAALRWTPLRQAGGSAPLTRRSG